MTIRLFCNPPGTFALLCLDRLRDLAGTTIESVVVAAKVEADFTTAPRALVPVGQSQDANLNLLATPDFRQAMETAVDQMSRTRQGYVYRPHNLVNLQDYLDYFHILSDISARQLTAARSTHVLFLDLPRRPEDIVLHDTARAMGIETVILTGAPVANRSFSMRRIEDLGAFAPEAAAAPWPIGQGMAAGGAPLAETDAPDSPLGLGHFLTYAAARKPLRAFNPLSLARTFLRARRLYGGFPNWRDPFARFFDQDPLAYIRHLSEDEDQPVDWTRKFVCFPLHLQADAPPAAEGAYADQVQAIEDLSRHLPPDWLIVVKECPKRAALARGPMFFHRLKRIRQVRFAKSTDDANHLLQRSQFVAGVSGLAGWQAITQGKPAVVFGRTWFCQLPGIHRFSPDLDPLAVAASVIDRAAMEGALGTLMARSHDGYAGPDWQTAPANQNPAKTADSVARAVLGLLRGEVGFTFGD